MLAVLAALLAATDLAVIALFVALRRQGGGASVAVAPVREVETQLSVLQAHAEQACAELARQQAQLRRLLDAPTESAAPVARVPAPYTPESVADIIRFVREGMPAPTAAARAGTNLEEVRLALALGEPRVSA